MTLLEIVEMFCERKNITVPATVIGSADTQVVQIRALLEKEGIALRKRHAWEGVTKEATHTSLAAEDQGAMTTIAASGFDYIVNQTIWDRTDKLPICGPMSSQEWQAVKALAPTGPKYSFRIRGGKLLINPTPTAGHAWAFEYVSKFWIAASAGTTPTKTLFTLDTDTVSLPDEIVALGLEWRWKHAKGLEYAEDFRDYEAMVKDAMGRDGGKAVLNMAGGRSARPGILVPQGSWPVP